jgi:hypothetical protein
MTEKDLIEIQDGLELLKYTKLVKRGDKVGIHSGWPKQADAIISILEIVPEIITINEWHIEHYNFNKYDLLCFFNVFHYIKYPMNAFKNVFNSCRYLLIQDLIVRDRGDNILGLDGDSMRYSFDQIRSNYHKSFDISKFRSRIIIFSPYIDDGQYLHFISLMKGNL